MKNKNLYAKSTPKYAWNREPMNLIDEKSLLEVIDWFNEKIKVHSCSANCCIDKIEDYRIQRDRLEKVYSDIRKTLPNN